MWLYWSWLCLYLSFYRICTWICYCRYSDCHPRICWIWIWICGLHLWIVHPGQIVFSRSSNCGRLLTMLRFITIRNFLYSTCPNSACHRKGFILLPSIYVCWFGRHYIYWLDSTLFPIDSRRYPILLYYLRILIYFYTLRAKPNKVTLFFKLGPVI